MIARNYPSDILPQANNLLSACQQIDPAMSAGTLTITAFADSLTQVQQTQSQIDALERQLTELRIKRDDQLRTIWDSVKRWRSMVKAMFGGDSPEYELVGGTRFSERKRPARRASN